MKKILSLLVMLLLLVSCGKSSSYLKEESYESSNGYFYSNVSEDGSYSYGDENNSNEINIQKLIKNVSINLQTKEFNEAINLLNQKIKEFNGYTISSNINKYTSYQGYEYHEGSLTIRIPVDNLDAFLAVKDESWNITSVSEKVEDITTQYYDLAAELDSLKAQEEKLLEFYDKAETISDLMDIEERIADVRYRYNSKMTTMENYNLLTAYATVNIYIKEVIEYTEVRKNTFFTRLIDTIKDSASNFLDTLEELLFAFIYLLPFGLVIVLIIFILKKLNIKIKFKGFKRKKKEIKEEENNNIL